MRNEGAQPHRVGDGGLEVPKQDVEEVVLSLAKDGIVVSHDEARRAIENVAELLLLISRPLPLPPERGRFLDS